LFMDVCQSQRFIKVCQKVFVSIHGFTWVKRKPEDSDSMPLVTGPFARHL
jgi:hypothetical protein